MGNYNIIDSKPYQEQAIQIINQRIAFVDEKRSVIQKKIKHPNPSSEVRIFFRALLKKGMREDAEIMRL